MRSSSNNGSPTASHHNTPPPQGLQRQCPLDHFSKSRNTKWTTARHHGLQTPWEDKLRQGHSWWSLQTELYKAPEANYREKDNQGLSRVWQVSMRDLSEHAWSQHSWGRGRKIISAGGYAALYSEFQSSQSFQRTNKNKEIKFRAHPSHSFTFLSFLKTQCHWWAQWKALPVTSLNNKSTWYTRPHTNSHHITNCIKG